MLPPRDMEKEGERVRRLLAAQRALEGVLEAVVAHVHAVHHGVLEGDAAELAAGGGPGRLAQQARRARRLVRHRRILRGDADLDGRAADRGGDGGGGRTVGPVAARPAAPHHLLILSVRVGRPLLFDFVGLALASVAATRLRGRGRIGGRGGVAPRVAARVQVGEAARPLGAAAAATDDSRRLFAEIQRGSAVGRIRLFHQHHLAGAHAVGVQRGEYVAAFEPLVGRQRRLLPVVSRVRRSMVLLLLRFRRGGRSNTLALPGRQVTLHC